EERVAQRSGVRGERDGGDRQSGDRDPGAARHEAGQCSSGPARRRSSAFRGLTPPGEAATHSPLAATLLRHLAATVEPSVHRTDSEMGGAMRSDCSKLAPARAALAALATLATLAALAAFTGTSFATSPVVTKWLINTTGLTGYN